MNTYERIFGAGPRGLLISLALLALTWQVETAFGLPGISDSQAVRWVAFGSSAVGTLLLAGWSAKSLPPATRGKELVTAGPYRYVRHPVYAAFLSCFNFGLAVFLNNWIYVAWAVLLHGVWHWNVRSEEKLMAAAFPDEYPEYCRSTGRFVPRLRSLLRNPPVHPMG